MISLTHKKNIKELSTHAGTFVFKKIGCILSKETYNAKIIQQKKGRRLQKSVYAFSFDEEISTPSGCYMIFEPNKKQPSYIGKTIDITKRFKDHLCYKYFQEYTKNGQELDIFFCPDSKKVDGAVIEALAIGYLWHKKLWNRFNYYSKSSQKCDTKEILNSHKL